MLDERITPYLERIRGILPSLELRTGRFNSDGLANDVIVANEEIVFRFAKGEYGQKALRVELQILELVDSHLSFPVPRPFYTSADAIAYPLLAGEPLTPELTRGMAVDERQAAALGLGRFLAELHSIPVSDDLPASLAPVTRDAWQDLERRMQEKVYPLLLPHQRRWAETLLGGMLDDPQAFDYPPALIHGDLAPYHILYDPGRKQLAGVIDFGVAGRGDPATDLAAALQAYGESFLRQALQAYPAGNAHLRRARFYAQAIELQWVLLGLESGENFWFTAHLGGARDLGC